VFQKITKRTAIGLFGTSIIGALILRHVRRLNGEVEIKKSPDRIQSIRGLPFFILKIFQHAPVHGGQYLPL